MNPTQQEILNIMYEIIEVMNVGLELFSLERYIDACDNLDDEEKKWAKEHLNIALTVK